jgi:hypothetical protein
MIARSCLRKKSNRKSFCGEKEPVASPGLVPLVASSFCKLYDGAICLVQKFVQSMTWIRSWNSDKVWRRQKTRCT